jgi:hypothetical protein
MARIFVSFATQDTQSATDLSSELLALGHEVFRVDEGLTAGQQLEDTIGREVRAADALLVLVSQTSARSAWVMHEAGMAIGYAREKGRPLLLPVLLDQVEIPGPLRSIQALVAYDRDLKKLAEQIDRILQQQLGRLKAREQEQQEVAKRVEVTAASYIRRSREELDRRENRYRRIAYLWYCLAFGSLAAGVAFAFWRAHRVHATSDWIQLAELLALGIVVVALLAGLSKLSFSLGKAFMVEALRNADRSHAISFGEFYLNAFGDKAAWVEVKEAFQHWNVDKGSSFASQTTKDYDPQVLELAVELIKHLKPELKK